MFDLDLQLFADGDPDPKQPDPKQPDPKQPDPKQPDPKQPDPEPKRGTKTDEEWEAQLRRTRDEAAAARKEAADLKKEKEDRENEELKAKGELQKLLDKANKKADDAAAEATTKAAKADQKIMRTELRSLAREAGILDPDLISLMDTSNVKVNEDGEVEGAEDAIEAFKKAKPKLFGAVEEEDPNKRNQRGQRQTPPGNSPGKIDTKKDWSKVPLKELNAAWEGSNGQQRFQQQSKS